MSKTRVAMLPAMSRQAPLNARVGLAGGPFTSTGVHWARPDSASLARKRMTTGWLYQPSWSGGRTAMARLITGGVASKRSGNAAVAEFPALSIQEPATEAEAESRPEYRASVH